MLPRVVATETLDALPAQDPAAVRSRGDLRRVHRVMGTRAILLRAFRAMLAKRRGAGPIRVLEIGAGDGSLMLGVARTLAPEWPPVELTLFDRLDLVDPVTVAQYAELGWTVVIQVGDVLDWAAADHRAPHDDARATWDLIVANLFVHHFEGPQLVVLLGAITRHGERFFACEPRRAWLALAGSHMLGAMGANAVTREDAVLSVHAGFRDSELTSLWPFEGPEWQIQEYAAGLFSHCFRAERLEVS